ncbi:MAG: trypsin-like peptidase domain-containing protein [Eubacteriales bacterium]|nr:trypsin-like peptidase domain-containing protein [Eubacteriales bacterium]
MYNDNNENDSQYRYSGSDIPYNNTNNNTTNSSFNNNSAFSSTPYEPKKHKKHSSGFAKRATCFVLAAVLFGVIAGSVMFGVNYAGGKIVGSSKSDATGVNISTVSSNISNVSKADSSLTEDTNLSSSTKMDVEAVATAALPAMVELNGTTTVTNSSYFGYGQSYEATSSGTGIIVGKSDTELLIVTNAHVVDNIDNLKCVFSDGTSANCSVKGSKSDQDIAVAAVALTDISSDTASNIAIAELEDSSDINVGQQVVAIGNALGEGQSVTTGIISAKDRSITVNNVTFTGLLMTDAAINSGNSGGALLNSEGKVIAINFAKTSSDGVEGMAYSIPVSNVKDIIDSLMTKQTRNKVSADKAAYLGIAAVDITSNYASYYGYPVGILIRTVADNSAADKAGLETYDIIVGFDDQTVTTMSGLTNMLQYYEAGEKVTIDYYHMEGSEYVLKSTEVTLGSKKSS